MYQVSFSPILVKSKSVSGQWFPAIMYKKWRDFLGSTIIDAFSWMVNCCICSAVMIVDRSLNPSKEFLYLK